MHCVRVSPMGHEESAFLLEHGLVVTTAPSKGRCLVANRVFRPGDIILEQEPFSSVLNTDSSNLRCDGCFVLSDHLQRCSACKSVRYCSTACQRYEWSFHKSECKILVRLLHEKRAVPPPSLRLMIRLLVKRRLQSDGVIRTTPADKFELVEALPTHFAETGEERLVLYAQMSHLVKSVLSPLDIDLKETTQLFCRFACNAHTICDEELRPIGTGLYPLISIINHSCSPNSVLVFDGKRAVVRALDTISAGTEVTISYVELAASTQTRQKALKEQYFFCCCCSRCTRKETSEGMIEDAILEGYKCSNGECEGASLSLSDGKRLVCFSCGAIHVEMRLKALGVEANKLLEEGGKAHSSGNNGQARILYEQAELMQAKIWHRYSMNLMRTRDILLKICMSLQDWKSALMYCQLTIPAYQKAYARHSPLLGLQYYTLGKLAWFLSNTVEAVNALRQAREVLSITHMPSSPMLQGLSSLLQEACAESAYKEWRHDM